MDQTFINLTKLIKDCDNVFLMTHKNPDFDGIGAAIAMQQIIHSFHKESYIVLNQREKDKSLAKTYRLLIEDDNYFSTISSKEASKMITSKTLLIILDTSKITRVEEPDLVDKISNIVIIDHHIKNKEYIKKSVLAYNNSALSSTIEFVVEYLRYLNKTVSPFIATVMLVGLEIDTNSFKLKVTDKTYEAAAQLTRMGADSVIKQELLQETKNSYLKRQKLIEKSFMVNKNMAMCVADSTKYYEPKELAAIAEELLQFENVEASFVIGKIDKENIGVSARSLGNIDVDVIMEILGGGGHMNSAAAKVKEKILAKVEKQVLDAIGE